MTESVVIPFSGDFKDVINGVKKTTNNIDREVQNISKSFGAVKVAFGAIFAGVAVREVAQAIGTVTDAAAVQEAAVNQLNTALMLAGDFTEEASAGMQEFASELQAASTIGDETTLQMLALAKSFDVSNEGAQDLVTAAADLSAATGISLESAVKNLGKTYSGLTGELGEVVPALKGLTAEQLKAGAGIELIANRFAGAAQGEVRTYAGAITQLSNTFGDLLEEIGFVITKNPTVIAAIRGLSEFFQKLGDKISNNKAEVSDFVTTLTALASEGVPVAVASAGVIASAIQEVTNTVQLARISVKGLAAGLAELFGEDDDAAQLRNEIEAISTSLVKTNDFFEDFDRVINIANVAARQFADGVQSVAESAEDSTKAIENLGDKAGDSSNKVIIGAEDAVKGYDELIKQLDKTRVASEEAGKSEIELIDLRLQRSVDSIAKTIEELEATGELTEAREDQLAILREELESLADKEKAIKKVTKAEEDAKKALDRNLAAVDSILKANQQRISIQKEIAAAAGDLVEIAELETEEKLELIKAEEDRLRLLGKLDPATQKLLNESRKLTQEVAKQKEFTAKVLELSGTIKTFFGSGFIGEGLQKVVNFFAEIAQNPAAIVGKFVEALEAGVAAIFTDVLTGDIFAEFGDIVQSIGDLPGNLIEIFANLDDIIRGFIQNFPDAINNLVMALPQIAESFARKFPELVDLLVEEFPKLAETLAPILSDALVNLFEQLPKIISALPKILEPFIRELPKIFESLFENLPDIILSLLDAVGDVIASVVEKLPDIFISLLENFDAIVEALVNGLVANIVKIAVALVVAIAKNIVPIAIAFVEALGGLIPAVLEGFRQGIEEGFNIDFGEIGGKIADGFKNAPDVFLEAGRSIATGISEFDFAAEFANLEDIFRDLGTTIFDGFEDGFNELIDRLKNAIRDLIPGGGGGASGLGESVQEGVNNILGRSIGTSTSSTAGAESRSIGGDTTAPAPAQGGGGAAQPVQIVLQVGQQQLADVMVSLKRDGFRVA